MPERDFAALIRQSRERLGLTSSRVAELIGRAPGTIRAWEKGTSLPSEPSVVSSLAAVLGIEEVTLFEAAGLEPPVVGSGPTVRQALSSITPEARRERSPESPQSQEREPPAHGTTFQPRNDRQDEEADVAQTTAARSESTTGVERQTGADRRPRFLDRLRAATVRRQPSPGSAPSTLPPVPRAPSYLEDPTERWSYRLRSIYTAAGVVAMLVVLGWAASNLFGSLGEVWEILTSNL